MSKTITTHPGEILKDEIEARGLTANRFAIEIGVPATRIGEILHLRRAVTPETALRLAAYFGGSPKVWLSLQAKYDLAEAEKKHGKEIRRTVSIPAEKLKRGETFHKEMESYLEKKSIRELLNLHGGVLEELRSRGVLRSSNNPVGDYAEYLFCKALGWELADNSERDIDAFAQDGTSYQIKGRRLTRHNASRQLSALRRLPDENFKFLAGVLFNEDFTILNAALIPHRLVLENSTYVEATNSWRFLLRDETWEWPGVKDVTETLKKDG